MNTDRPSVDWDAYAESCTRACTFGLPFPVEETDCAAHALRPGGCQRRECPHRHRPLYDNSVQLTVCAKWRVGKCKWDGCVFMHPSPFLFPLLDCSAFLFGQSGVRTEKNYASCTGNHVCRLRHPPVVVARLRGADPAAGGLFCEPWLTEGFCERGGACPYIHTVSRYRPLEAGFIFLAGPPWRLRGDMRSGIPQPMTRPAALPVPGAGSSSRRAPGFPRAIPGLPAPQLMDAPAFLPSDSPLTSARTALSLSNPSEYGPTGSEGEVPGVYGAPRLHHGGGGSTSSFASFHSSSAGTGAYPARHPPPSVSSSPASPVTPATSLPMPLAAPAAAGSMLGKADTHRVVTFWHLAERQLAAEATPVHAFYDALQKALAEGGHVRLRTEHEVRVLARASFMQRVPYRNDLARLPGGVHVLPERAAFQFASAEGGDGAAASMAVTSEATTRAVARLIQAHASGEAPTRAVVLLAASSNPYIPPLVVALQEAGIVPVLLTDEELPGAAIVRGPPNPTVHGPPAEYMSWPALLRRSGRAVSPLPGVPLPGPGMHHGHHHAHAASHHAHAHHAPFPGHGTPGGSTGGSGGSSASPPPPPLPSSSSSSFLNQEQLQRAEALFIEQQQHLQAQWHQRGGVLLPAGSPGLGGSGSLSLGALSAPSTSTPSALESLLATGGASLAPLTAAAPSPAPAPPAVSTGGGLSLDSFGALPALPNPVGFYSL